MGVRLRTSREPVEQGQEPPLSADPDGELAPGRAESSFRHIAGTVLERLQKSLIELLRSAPGNPRKAAEVERTFGVDYKLGWQVHRIATERNPLAAGMHVPARVSIQKLLRAAAKSGVPADITDEVSAAFERFEQLLEEEAHDRQELETLLAPFVPEAREKNELAIKETAFRAQSQLKGVAMEAQVGTFFLRPSADGLMVDRTIVSAYVGLRRLRADSHIGFGTLSASLTGTSALTLDGLPAGEANSTLLKPFCSSPVPAFDAATVGPMTTYTIAGADVGLGSAVDLVMAEHLPSAMRRYVTPDGRRMTGIMNIPDIPMKRQTTDIFVHRDVYAGAAPELGVYDTVPRGMVTRLNDPERAKDRVPFHERIESLVGGPTRVHLDHFPAYSQVLAHVCERQGLDPSAFRGFRLDVLFPVYGAQYMVGFPLAETPHERG